MSQPYFEHDTTEEEEEEYEEPIPHYLLPQKIHSKEQQQKEEENQNQKKKKDIKTIHIIDYITYSKPEKRLKSDDYYEELFENECENNNTLNNLIENLQENKEEKNQRKYQKFTHSEKNLILLNQAIETLEKEIEEEMKRNEIQLYFEKKKNESIPTKLTNEIINEIYGDFRPIGKDIERNEIEKNQTGLIELHSLPNELDEIFTQFILSNDEKEVIKERFDTVLDSLLFFIDSQNCEDLIDQTLLIQFAEKHHFPIEWITNAFQIITQMKENNKKSSK